MKSFELREGVAEDVGMDPVRIGGCANSSAAGSRLATLRA